MKMATAQPASSHYLVSGASGLLGTALRQALAAGSLPVLQLVRRPPEGSNQLQWNPAAEPSVANPQALEGLAGVIHLAGANVAAHRWTAAYKREIAASRIDSTRALAATLARLSRPPQVLVVASATGFYGNRAAELLDETSSPGSGFLAGVCQKWEAAAQPAVDAGIRVVHLRLGVVLGPGPGALAAMLPLFRLGLGGRLGNGRQWMSWISLPDAVAATLFVLRTPALAGPGHLTPPNPVPTAPLTRALARALRRPAILPPPAFALRLALGPMADEALLASARVFPSRLLTSGFRFEHPTVAQALAAALQ